MIFIMKNHQLVKRTLKAQITLLKDYYLLKAEAEIKSYMIKKTLYV